MVDDPLEPVSEITCEQVAAWASAYLDDHVEDVQKIRIVLHLVACAGCDAYVKQIVSVCRVLDRLPLSPTHTAQLDPVRQAFAARHKPPSSA
jgi:predicted anti-sigma-YlaC factor YlaD